MQYHTLTSRDKAILFRTAGKCKICSGKSGSNRLVTDHCHTTGIVRGVLCEKCNSWLGVIEGKRETKVRIKYIQKLESATKIPALNFMFYLDNFRRAYINSLFKKEVVVKTKSRRGKDKPQPKHPKGKTMVSVIIE